MIQIKFLYFLVFDHFDAHEAGVLDVIDDFRHFLGFLLPEKVEFEKIMIVFDFGEPNFFLVELVDDGSSVIDGDGFPTLLFDFFVFAIINDTGDVRLNQIKIFL